MGAMVYVGLVLVVVGAVLLIYWSRDKAGRWRYFQAWYVVMGLYFGAQALDRHQRHGSGWMVALAAVCAVGFVICGIGNLWRGKRPEPQPASEDPPGWGAPASRRCG
jgi:hypothetical protein